MDDNSIFAQIAKELAAGIKDDALWLKAFSSENGDEAKSKAHYVRLRAEQLKNIKPTAIPRHAASTTSPPSRLLKYRPATADGGMERSRFS